MDFIQNFPFFSIVLSLFCYVVAFGFKGKKARLHIESDGTVPNISFGESGANLIHFFADEKRALFTSDVAGAVLNENRDVSLERARIFIKDNDPAITETKSIVKMNINSNVNSGDIALKTGGPLQQGKTQDMLQMLVHSNGVFLGFNPTRDDNILRKIAIGTNATSRGGNSVSIDKDSNTAASKSDLKNPIAILSGLPSKTSTSALK